ncbi:multidrug transporter [Hymenobacter humi]|uniref:Multidrug transporter n=1 Tax=Hymenobacter humi TaxID=1411620 RepID=A0ABW2UCE8_9BACT
METTYKLNVPVSTAAVKKAGKLSIDLVPSKVTKWLLAVTAVLLLANILVIVLKLTMEHQTRLSWYFDQYFNFNYEGNFPTFFSSLILALAAGILLFLYFITKQQKNSQAPFRWLILSLIFTFLAIDENIQIHELITKIVRPRLTTELSGFLHWAWVVPYSIAFVFIVGYFTPFVLKLPAKTRNMIMLAGFMYVFGAVGLELVEGHLYMSYGVEHIFNQLLYCVEELLEMTAVILFIHTLLGYIVSIRVNLRLRSR